MFNATIIGFGAVNISSGGSVSASYVEKTSNYTVLANDYTINCTANSFDVTMLTAVGIKGQVFNIKNSGEGVITIKTTGGQTIDEGTSLTLSQYDNLQIQSNGQNWIIL